MSFQTVRKYACKEDWNEEKLPNLEAENDPAGSGQADFGESIYYDGKGQEQKDCVLTASFPPIQQGIHTVLSFAKSEMSVDRAAADL